jgi:hypothetical protein
MMMGHTKTRATRRCSNETSGVALMVNDVVVERQRIIYYLNKYQRGEISVKTLYEKIIYGGNYMKVTDTQKKLGMLRIQREDIERELDVLGQEVSRLNIILKGIKELEEVYHEQLRGAMQNSGSG